MSEERKKKSGAAWKAEEDEKLNKSRAFVELTEYRANAVDNDTHFFILAELHIKLYSLQTGGSQWGGGFYGYRLKFWLFYGYRLILISYG